MKVIPDYQTVEDSSKPVAPMTSREKWRLAWKETIDPFNIATAAFTAAESQRGNQTPKYGEGWPNYGRRFGQPQSAISARRISSAPAYSPTCSIRIRAISAKAPSPHGSSHLVFRDALVQSAATIPALRIKYF